MKTSTTTAPAKEKMTIDPKSKAQVEMVGAALEADENGMPILDADGDATHPTRATTDARKKAGEDSAKVIDKEAAGEPLEPLPDDPQTREELESETPDQRENRVGAPDEKGDRRGTHLSPHAFRALKNLNAIHRSILRMLMRASRDKSGEVFQVLLNKATGRNEYGKKIRYGSFGPELRKVVPFGVKISKAGSVFVELLDLHQLQKNVQARANSDRGKRLYGGDITKIMEDVETVAALHAQGKKTDEYFAGKYGEAKGREHKNFINSVLDVQTPEQKQHNPQILEDDVKGGSVMKSFRIDRISKAIRTEDNSLPFSYPDVKFNHFPSGTP